MAGTLDFRLLSTSFSNEGWSSILSEIASSLTRLITNVARCRDGEVCIQCALKLANVDLGC